MKIMLLLLIILFEFRASANAADLSSLPVDRLEVKNGGAIDLAFKMHVPMGIELFSVHDPSSHNKLKATGSMPLALKRVTVAQALDEICRKSDSEWSEQDGVISVHPKVRDLKAEYFLNKRVGVDAQGQDREDLIEAIFRDWSLHDPSIEITTNTVGIAIQHDRTQLVFFQQKVTGPIGFHSMDAEVDLPKHDVALKGKTLREVLNILAKLEHVVWTSSSDYRGLGALLKIEVLPVNSK